MRYSRSQILPAALATVHKYWRCHNRSFLLQGAAMKELYLKSTEVGLKHVSSAQSVKLHAFGIMDNHVHQVISYVKELEKFSAFMRVAHGVFGRRFNLRNQRSGKVANERPKTSLVQNVEHAMRVQFYVEANPVRAGICRPENLKLHAFSSYRFYAYGMVDQFTRMLTPPEWYLALGNTPAERQSRYRSLFTAYVRESEGGSRNSNRMLALFIGDNIWAMEHLRALRSSRFKGRDAPPNSESRPI